jgi:hypothetical protein
LQTSRTSTSLHVFIGVSVCVLGAFALYFKKMIKIHVFHYSACLCSSKWAKHHNSAQINPFAPPRRAVNFFYFFYHDFAKIYGPPEILQNYTSTAVAHGVRDITSWPTAVGAASSGPVGLTVGLTAAGHNVRDLTSCPAVLGPDAMGHSVRCLPTGGSVAPR